MSTKEGVEMTHRVLRSIERQQVLFERSEFLIRTIQKKGCVFACLRVCVCVCVRACVYPFKLGFRVIYLILDCCR